MSSEHFADRLTSAIETKRSCLVVGIDPVLERLPRELLGVPAGSKGAGYTAKASVAVGLFTTGVIEAVKDLAVAVKPNSAFFERFGAAGWECLKETCRLAKKAGLLVILDAKRGDIGHTAEAYADALLGDVPDTPGPYVDALTVNPYLGTESLEPFFAACSARGKGLFVLVRTSNPSAAEIQDLAVDGEPLHLRVARLVARWGESSRGASGLSSIGAVVGATAPEEARRIREVLPGAYFLVPGYGAQGAAAALLGGCFLPGGGGAVVNSSRAILFAHEKRAGRWTDAVREAATEARDELNRTRLPAGGGR
ncbi:MAG TPA: orotidine-5'-phosphate decarboxylase [Planctomycetota bacterium]|jgi:orotidine-5'-phosphate decarboxylase|nr:orotidine-5'-phosphate decarboxylase [Planctomycetota bacterium]